MQITIGIPTTSQRASGANFWIYFLLKPRDLTIHSQPNPTPKRPAVHAKPLVAVVLTTVGGVLGKECLGGRCTVRQRVVVVWPEEALRSRISSMMKCQLIKKRRRYRIRLLRSNWSRGSYSLTSYLILLWSTLRQYIHAMTTAEDGVDHVRLLEKDRNNENCAS